jgi:hypothetical protein
MCFATVVHRCLSLATFSSRNVVVNFVIRGVALRCLCFTWSFSLHSLHARSGARNVPRFSRSGTAAGWVATLRVEGRVQIMAAVS